MNWTQRPSVPAFPTHVSEARGAAEGGDLGGTAYRDRPDGLACRPRVLGRARLVAIAVLTALAAAGNAAGAVVRLFDNITGPPNTTGVNSETATSSAWVAQAFVPSTSGVANLLSFWSQCVGGTCTGSGVLEIHADAAGQPGAQLGSGAPFTNGATLDGSPICAVMGGTAPNLAAGTTYWAVMRGSNAGLITWNYQSNASRTVLKSANSGVTWTQGTTSKTFGLRVDQGTTCGPNVTANPAAGTKIGPLFAGAGAASSTVFLANGGNADLVLNSAAFTGPGAAAFQLLDQQPGPTARPLTFPRTIGTVPGQGQIMWVVCPPSTVEGTRTATLTVTTNDPNAPSVQWPVECVIDRTPPTVEFSQTPTGTNGWWASVPARLTITGVDPQSGNQFSRLICTDNGTRVISVRAGAATYQTSTQGSHAISCSAIDIAGNASGQFTTTMQIDSVPPVVPTTVTPPPNAAGWHRVAAVTVAFGTCSDAAPSSGLVTNTIGGGGTLSAETAGTVVAPTGACIDAAGNAAAPSVTLKIDRTPPVIVANVPPGNAGGWHNAGFVVDWQCTDPGVARSGVASDTLTDVTINFDVDASLLSSGGCVDVAGNTASSPGQTPVRLDATAPVTTLDPGPASPTNATSATFTFGGSDGLSGVVGFECGLDGAAFASCTSPATFSGLAEGPHTLAVRAVDAADNLDQTPQTATWTVDVTAPRVEITTSPGDPTADIGASIGFTGTDAVTPAADLAFACSLDGAPFESCASPFEAAALSAGSHTLRVRATDQATNTTAPDAIVTWRVDLTAPTTSITSGPTGTVATAGATFGFTATDAGGSTVAGFDCALDGGPFAPCTSPVTFAGLAEGVHDFRVRARDALGNVESPSVSRTWTVASAAAPQQPVAVGGAVPGAGLADTPPGLTLAGAAIQRPLRLRKRQLVLRATCDESCTLAISGAITIAGRRTRLQLPVIRSVAGAGATAGLRIALSRRAQTLVRAALASRRVVRVRIQVVATDSAGQTTTATRTITLRR